MAASHPMSPSRNSISSWFKSLKKSDSSNDLSSSSSHNRVVSPPPWDLNDPAATYNDPDSLAPSTNAPTAALTPQPTRITSNPTAPPVPVTVLQAPTPVKNQSRKNSSPLSINILSPQKAPHTQNQQLAQAHHSSQLSSSPTPSRPFLGFKSRSSHSFRPLSQFLDSSSPSNSNQEHAYPSIDSTEKLRSHRDSFLQQRQLDTIGDSLIFGCDIETSTNTACGTIYISGDVPLQTDTKHNVQTNTAMKDNANNIPNSNTNDDDNSKNNLNLSYGKVPLVIVSCGSYLKRNGLKVEGIFRLAGSNKRIKHLQMIFSTPPTYGAKINWDGYTVHDAASLLRRYLGSLSEPLIPLNFYDSFRNPLIEKTELIQYFKEKDNDNLEFYKKDKKLRRLIVSQRRQLLKEYALLFQKLPPIQRRVLFYLLDMLAMFNINSDHNRMPAKNLAAIFQPSILFHPDHDMDPDEYAINSLVIEVMITYSYKILVNVQNDESLNNSVKSNFLTAKDDNHDLSSPVSNNANNKIIEEKPELDNVFKEKNRTTDENQKEKLHLNGPSIHVFSSEESLLKYSKNCTPSTIGQSPLKGSPLKHMVTPLDDRKTALLINNLEAPKTLYSSPKADRNRPYSKSLSQVPHSDIVRIPKYSNVDSTDDNLTRITSNQSVVSSVLSSQISGSNDKLPKTSTSHDQLIKELGLSSQPDIIHTVYTSSPGNKKPGNITSQTISMKNLSGDCFLDTSLSPITPTMEDIFKREITPEVEVLKGYASTTNTSNNKNKNNNNYNNNNNNNHNNSNVNATRTSSNTTTHITVTHKHDGENMSSKGNDSSSVPETQSTITTMSELERNATEKFPGKSTTSLPFSFQPSLLDGHQNTIESQTPVSKIEHYDKNQSRSLDCLSDQAEGSKSLDKCKIESVYGFENVKFSHPDIINDPSLLRKTATTPSIGSLNASVDNDEDDNIHVKKRSNSTVLGVKHNNNSGRRNSNLFALVANHKMSLNINREDHSMANIQEDQTNLEKVKEKRNWFDKLKSRSNSKR